MLLAKGIILNLRFILLAKVIHLNLDFPPENYIFFVFSLEFFVVYQLIKKDQKTHIRQAIMLLFIVTLHWVACSSSSYVAICCYTTLTHGRVSDFSCGIFFRKVNIIEHNLKFISNCQVVFKRSIMKVRFLIERSFEIVFRISLLFMLWAAKQAAHNMNRRVLNSQVFKISFFKNLKIFFFGALILLALKNVLRNHLTLVVVCIKFSVQHNITSESFVEL